MPQWFSACQYDILAKKLMGLQSRQLLFAEPGWRSAMIWQNLEEKTVIVSGERTRQYSRLSCWVERLRWEHSRTTPKPKQSKAKPMEKKKDGTKMALLMQYCLLYNWYSLMSKRFHDFYSFVWTFNQFHLVLICVPNCSCFIWVWTDFFKSPQTGCFYCSWYHFYLFALN